MGILNKLLLVIQISCLASIFYIFMFYEYNEKNVNKFKIIFIIQIISGMLNILI